MSARPSTRGSARPSARNAGKEESKEALTLAASGSSSGARAKATADFLSQSDDAAALRASIAAVVSAIAQEEAAVSQYSALRDRAEASYQQERSRRRELKMELRARLAGKAEAADSQRFELQLHKEKMKALMLDHSLELSGLRVLGKQSELQDERRRSAQEAEQEDDNRRLLSHSAQRDAERHQLLNRLKLLHEEATMLLREDFERRSNELRRHAHKQLRSTRERLEAQRKQSIARLEQRKQQHTAGVIASHKQQMDDMKRFYSDITHANLELIRSLKEEIGDMRKKEQQGSGEVRRMQRLTDRLEQPLSENAGIIDALRQRLTQHRTEAAEVERLRLQLGQLERDMERVKWETEVLTQKRGLVDSERSELQRHLRQQDTQAQQQRLFSSLIASRQIAVLQAETEKAEAGLSELLLSSGLDAATLGGVERGLQSILLDKNREILALEDEVKEWKQRFTRMMAEYEEEMRLYGLPVEELGFIPVKSI
jgi:hypothetical protein